MNDAQHVIEERERRAYIEGRVEEAMLLRCALKSDSSAQREFEFEINVRINHERNK